MKICIAIAVSLMLVCALSLSCLAEGDALSWYCTRNKEHRQPVLGPDLAFAEQMGAYYVDRAHSEESGERVVYLTFDAGYENGNVARILDTLADKQVSGAFFILGNLIRKNPELVRRMADEGHLVCNHTLTHADMSAVGDLEAFKAELCALESLYLECTGRELSRYFRPPEGRFCADTLRYAQQLGYKTIFWSFAYEDWKNDKQMSAEAAKKKIMDNVHNGAIILLHPTSDTNAAVLGEVIDLLREQGYSFGSLDALR